VDQLLDATRIEAGMLKPTLEWCDPAELARDAIQHAEIAPEVLGFQPPGDLPLIRVDAGLVIQALATLLQNATTHGTAREPAGLTIRPDSGALIFEVADCGVGLPPGEEEKVFEKFYRAPGVPAGGVGLGLSIARQLAEVHGGTLTAQNRPAGGARFTLRLPIGGEPKLPE
jgi:two-component system sensor histidine kinase KdpD